MALTNSQHDAIMRMYNLIQIKNKHLLDERTLEVYKVCPKIKEVEDEIINLSITNAPLIIQLGNSALDQYKTKLNELISRRILLLSDLGYSYDYLDEIFDCPLCKDTGIVNGEQCSCFKKKVIDVFYLQSNLKNILTKENFDNFSFEWYSKDSVDCTTGLTPFNNMQKVLTICKDFIKNFDSSFNNLLFFGDTGVGKTFLSNCIACELLRSSHSVIYLTAIELFDIFAEHDFSHNKFNNIGETMSTYIIDCDLLIIDDLGTELSNSFTNSKLFYCVNERILKQKSTIISTNLAIRDLASNYSERIFSRISSSYTMLKLHGSDIRVEKRNSNKIKNS